MRTCSALTCLFTLSLFASSLACIYALAILRCRCGAGSTYATQNTCGNATVYCPLGSSGPRLVTPDYYTTPAMGSKALRTGQVRLPLPPPLTHTSTTSAFTHTRGTSSVSPFAQLPCEPFRICTDGEMLPGVDLSSSCGSITGGAMTLSMRESLANAEWGSNIPVSSPGYTGSMTWTVQQVTAVDSACVLSPSMFSITSYTGYGE